MSEPHKPPAVPPLDRPPVDPLEPAIADQIDVVVKDAIRRGDTPGAVVAIALDGELVFERAYGDRALLPERLPMTVDTHFDLSSLTKPLVTTLATFRAIDRGYLSLDTRVADHLPDFVGTDKAEVTVEQLLRHRSGLPAVNHLRDYKVGAPEESLKKTLATPLAHPPDTTTTYSDVGYITLAALVTEVAKQPFHAIAADICRPLDAELRFNSPGFIGPVATTEKRDGKWLAGDVHDARADALLDRAGHAGAFGTARQVLRIGTLLLERGEVEGEQLLPAPLVQRMLADSTDGQRTLGLNRIYGGVGHTGFSGTLLWLDPRRRAAVALMTNRLHPDGKGDVKQLRRDVVGWVRAAADRRSLPPLQVGADRLSALPVFKDVERVGVVTNHTGVDAAQRRTIDIVAGDPDAELTAIFTPEHGLRGTVDGPVANDIDEATAAPIFSLYGDQRRPTRQQLALVDTLVFDLQDAGARFFTYITTLGFVLEAAADAGVRVVVLDRPNPLGGDRLEGPLLDANRQSFVGYHTLPVRHGLTVGELAQLFVAERGLNVDLHVVRMRGWRRDALWTDLKRPWVPPSPNLKSPEAAMTYPGVALLEFTNVSVGRGTDTPFLLFGAPFVDGPELAKSLRGISGIKVEPTSFTPTSNKHAGVACSGVALQITDGHKLRSVELGLRIARHLHDNAPDWKGADVITLLGNEAAYRELVAGASVETMLKSYKDGLAAFDQRRIPFLLY